MKKKIEEILDILIEEIKEGKDIDACVKEYPEYADELKPLLLLATRIEESTKPEVDSLVFNRTMAKVSSLEEQSMVKSPLFGLRTLVFRPVVLRTASIILIFTFILSMTFSFSADSLPGDFLYPVRCFGEKAQLVMTFSNEGKAELHLKLADRKTEDFILTFKKEEKINRELLNAMFDETSNALRYCRFLSSDECSALISKAKDCCQSQLKVLEAIEPLVRGSDCSLVAEAIDKCSARCQCVDSCPCGDAHLCGE